jgi:primosomal protein N' (replication factor Y) (superfamily II helicase)
MIAKVQPITTARRLRGPFDYRLPEHMGDVRPGALLTVPFRRRRTLGVVVDLSETSEIDASKLHEPTELLQVSLPHELVSLGVWVGTQYCSTPARGLSLVLPPKRAATQAETQTALYAITDAGASALQNLRLGSRQHSVLSALQKHGPLQSAQLLKAAAASRPTLARLVDREFVTSSTAPQPQSVDGPAQRRPDGQDLGLTESQRGCLYSIQSALDDGGMRNFLLHGVTGSGKTEVYLRAAERALSLGRSVIVLVPEIALTSQTVKRFRDRFGDTVCVLHSRVSASQRQKRWEMLRCGAAKICIGARSAIFSPVADLGLVVVDEEHDASYKHEGDPRYDARQVAQKRASQCGAVVVFGSATPRVESYSRFERLQLPDRVDGRSLPPVECVSMAQTHSPLHSVTRQALYEVCRRGEKAIVLLNRRGWANFICCADCGRVWGCRECDVSLVLHQHLAQLVCHHCGHAEKTPRQCPDCGSVSLKRQGSGTQRIESELSQLVGADAVMRLDSDTATSDKALSEVLERFENASPAILLGTQMVSKGHDFPQVTLAVVLNADATLRFPDFRSEERCFSLVCQLAGRSGRGPAGGRVIVQAIDPQAEPLRYAASHDADGFLYQELKRRQALDYPPYSQLIRVVCASAQSGREVEAANALASATKAFAYSTDARLTVLGPAQLFRRRGRHRAQLLIKAFDQGAALDCVDEAVRDTSRKHSSQVAFSVDVDPQ